MSNHCRFPHTITWLDTAVYFVKFSKILRGDSAHDEQNNTDLQSMYKQNIADVRY